MIAATLKQHAITDTVSRQIMRVGGRKHESATVSVRGVGKLSRGGLKQSAQQDLHSFSWGVPVEGLAGAAVEFGSDVVKFNFIELG